jgi:hypothetical protein
MTPRVLKIYCLDSQQATGKSETRRRHNMSLKFTIATWSVEVDWEGLTVTPLPDDEVRRRKQIERERQSALELTPPASPDKGEKQAWA